MAKPRLIILIRHAQSEGNRNRDIHQTIPDHRVKLTQDGWSQALEAGRRLRKLLRPDDKLHFFTSPYRRTRETTEGILSTLTSDDEEPSPFRMSDIKVYEEPRLREQDFGNFQPCSAEMERMWQERADYGHFFYRIPNGESAADAYDRVSGFNESLWRQFGEDDFASVCVLVTHGLMSRVFLMKWYHFSVEYFEDLRNINHCEFLIMRKQDNGKYQLENNLRTWSELRREREIAAKVKDKSKDESKDGMKLDRSKTYISTRRWGGCPNGCNHTNHYKKREDLEVLRQKDVVESVQSALRRNGSSARNGRASIPKRPKRQAQGQDHETSDEGQRQKPGRSTRSAGETVSADGRASSPEDTRSFSSMDDRRWHNKHLDRLHLGRDFGGTYSGHTSVANSEDDASGDERNRHRNPTAKLPDPSKGEDTASNDGSRGAWANRLGDGSDGEGDAGYMEDLDKAEEIDKSVEGSVY